VNALLFFLASASLFFRRSLKTTLITLADAKAKPGLHRLVAKMTSFVNRVLGGDLRWQTLPVPFEVYADGIDLVVFEEFGAGREALHLKDAIERNDLMKDEAYRRRFRRDYEKQWGPRVWHRDFYDAHIVACPDPSVVGRTFGDVADARGIHPADAFLDLVVEHGTKIRWRTLIANHRPREIERMIREPGVLVGFADSGAHIRNMAFYNAPLRMLKLVRDAELSGRSVMPIEKAVWRLTGEIAEWFGIDAGHLGVGSRADVVVVDPRGLGDELGAYREAEMEGFGGLVRMVNRSDEAVCAVIVNGRVAFENGGVERAVGRELGFGRFLPAGERVPGTARPVAAVSSRASGREQDRERAA
jgi:N-acyl-D-glutamate deacylase